MFELPIVHSMVENKDSLLDKKNELRERFIVAKNSINSENPIGFVPDENIIPSALGTLRNFGTGEDVVYGDGKVPIFSDGSRTVAYINEANWSTAVVFPIKSGIDIYTDGAKNCSILAMKLKKDKAGFVLLSHVFYKRQHEQISSIAEYIKSHGFEVNDIVFSPRVDSREVSESMSVAKTLSDNVYYVQRDRGESASSIVNENGWMMTAGLKKNRRTYIEMWDAD